jgi:NDP-sugar pyrophosphorylase family protein
VPLRGETEVKAVILAGGYGTRIAEESGVRPKAMVEIGGRPLLWHTTKIYSAHGINEFIICGYKSEAIKHLFQRVHPAYGGRHHRPADADDDVEGQWHSGQPRWKVW